MRKWRNGTLAAAAALLLGASGAATAQSYSGIYIFGDSLVDSGNARDFALFADSLPFVDVADPAPPSLGYFQGRFSNGFNFADLVSIATTGTPPVTTFPYGYPFNDLIGQILPFPIPVPPIDPPDGNRINFAYGGAQANQGSELVPNLTRQVDAYAALPGGADPDALYVITMGGNDLRQLVPRDNPIAPIGTGIASLGLAADTILAQTQRLLDLGANNILLTGAPDISLLPLYLGLPDEAARRAAGATFTGALDDFLLSEIGMLTLDPDQRLTFFDFNAFSGSIVNNPGAFGFSNVTQSCLAVRGPSQNCDDFLYFDDVHPSAAAHRLVADAILAQLNVPAIPEPSTWATMLLGFAVIGAAMRRRKRPGAAAPDGGEPQAAG